MPDFRGQVVEPLVGEIVGLRTFRVDCTGTLLPLYSYEAWYDGPNTAACRPPSGRAHGPAHQAPHPDCECGFYVYGTPDAAGRNRNMRHVQAVVSCWGAVVAGTQGVRAEHARIDAVWINPHAPRWLHDRVRVRYPSAQVYADRDAMLAEHPPSVLPCYAPPTRRRVPSALVGLPGAGVVALGLVPYDVLTASTVLLTLWLAAVASALAFSAWCAIGLRSAGHLGAAGLVLTVVAWLVAPALGLLGWVVRVPLLHAAVVGCGGYLLSLRPRHFPVQEFERDPGVAGHRA